MKELVIDFGKKKVVCSQPHEVPQREGSSRPQQNQPTNDLDVSGQGLETGSYTGSNPLSSKGLSPAPLEDG